MVMCPTLSMSASPPKLGGGMDDNVMSIAYLESLKSDVKFGGHDYTVLHISGIQPLESSGSEEPYRPNFKNLKKGDYTTL